jgi:hypothetical protein
LREKGCIYSLVKYVFFKIVIKCKKMVVTTAFE